MIILLFGVHAQSSLSPTLSRTWSPSESLVPTLVPTPATFTKTNYRDSNCSDLRWFAFPTVITQEVGVCFKEIYNYVKYTCSYVAPNYVARYWESQDSSNCQAYRAYVDYESGKCFKFADDWYFTVICNSSPTTAQPTSPTTKQPSLTPSTSSPSSATPTYSPSDIPSIQTPTQSPSFSPSSWILTTSSPSGQPSLIQQNSHSPTVAPSVLTPTLAPTALTKAPSDALGIKTCTCQNGQATGSNGTLCQKNGQEACASCSTGYTLSEPAVGPQICTASLLAILSRLAFYAFAILFGAMVIIIALLRKYKHYKHAEYFSLLLPCFSLLDVVLDMLTVATMWNFTSKHLGVISLVCVVVPLVFSIVILVCLIQVELQHLNFNQWFKKYRAAACVMLFFCASNPASLLVLSSKVGNWQIFSAPLSPLLIARLRLSGLVSLMLEDLPQLLVQITYTTQSSSLSPVVVLSMCMSAFMILLGIVDKFLGHVQFLQEKSQLAEEEYVQL